ncbi:hypothetical protein OS493_018000 [Desmophyllum pertusum]|uniref:folate gamma-glutamyl hydrolase n=1 Tax=Desmophyllum pertusum TaxID=174260 RepID=A0A9W9Z0H7_9CNID|nr:hypothetical protein OS493_018000 [Desmophyllum pertusum]
MKAEEKTTTVLFVILVIHMSLAVEMDMDIFAEPFDHAGNRNTKNDRPIIGVLSQETDGNVTIFGSQLIAATYVKFIESAGGRMAPIFINSTAPQIEKLFNSINGAIFPGGHRLLHHSNYTRVGKQILELAIKAYDNGDVFPIWGECLGLELISMLVAGRDMRRGQLDSEFFTDVNAENISLTLNLPKDYKTASVWKYAPTHMVKYLHDNKVAYNNHVKAITPQTYHKNRLLKKFFRIVSTSKDRKGVEFISTMEGKKYPVYLFHWHPAKSQFEWSRDLDIKHSFRSILTGQYFANFFVQQAKLSEHQFPSVEEERATLISNYKPTDVHNYLPFVQAYFF